MKKIMTIAGARPDLIRLSEIIKKLDKHTDHIFVHTGQNFTLHLHDQFFDDLSLRKPDYQLNKAELTGFEFLGYMFIEIDKILKKEKPDAVLILGDVHSALSAYVCKRNKIPVFHMEAGNRCYSEKVPEEINRRIIDSVSEFLLTYTQRSREHLLREGYPPDKIIVTGNPIREIMEKHLKNSEIKKRDGEYVLVTLHRNENVTDKTVLTDIISALNEISQSTKVVLSVHPKLKSMIEEYNIKLSRNVETSEPFGFKEFLALEKNAKCVLSDSGTVPEECAILKVPCVLMRDSTERPELLENNSMILSGVKKGEILDAYEVAKNMGVGEIPKDYVDTDVSDKIVKILMRCV